jgi:hypothetical protein
MPIYMDRHYVEGATAHALAVAHTADLAGQNRYRVRFLTYWFDEVRSTAFWSTRRTRRPSGKPITSGTASSSTRSSRSTLL